MKSSLSQIVESLEEDIFKSDFWHAMYGGESFQTPESLVAFIKAREQQILDAVIQEIDGLKKLDWHSPAAELEKLGCTCEKGIGCFEYCNCFCHSNYDYNEALKDLQAKLLPLDRL